ncbi:hypothetical protein F4777DRAFT_535178 [Nemania sp. FL0916]|nr:hypothetical protein F4777DRAFT_535178 [Nemania sp. FL0916]
MDKALPDQVNIPDISERIWSDPNLRGKEDWFNAATYLLSKQQYQQKREYSTRHEQNDVTDRVLDRLALLFAYQKTSQTPTHVTATGIAREAEGSNLYVYIAKNGGHDTDKIGHACRNWLDEWFKSSPFKSSHESNKYWEALLNTWKNRINHYRKETQKMVESWDEVLEPSKDQIAAYFGMADSNFDRSQFNDEWKDTRDALQLAKNDDKDSTWIDYYNFWDTPMQYSTYLYRQELPKPGEGLIKYCKLIRYLEMLAMPMSIWRSLARFRELNAKKTIHFILVGKVELPFSMQSLQSETVKSELEKWKNGRIVDTAEALEKLNQAKKKQTRYLHCELQILMLFDQISSVSHESFRFHTFIGCSKLSCHLCWEILKNQRYKTRGTHAKISENCAFPLPRSLDKTVSTFLQLQDRWKLMFSRHQDGCFTKWDPHLDTAPTHTKNNNFDKEIAEKRFQDIGICGYEHAKFPFRKEPYQPRSGGFSKVWAASLSKPGNSLSGPFGDHALKEIIITSRNKLDKTVMEIEILRDHRHKNIAVLKEAFYDKSDPRIVYLGMFPWAPDTLDGLLRSLMRDEEGHEWHKQGTLGHWPSIAVQCLEGLAYLHRNNTKHRDIKPHNILLQRVQNSNTGYEIRPIITDFNISKNNYEGRGTTDTSGTPPFQAPEQLRGYESENTLLSDVWSLGCCFAFIFILIHSGGEKLTVFWTKVISSEEPGFHKLKNQAALIAIMEARNSNTRDTISLVFITGFKKLIRSMLERKPTKRISAEKALLDMKELEGHCSILGLDLPRIHVCFEVIHGKALAKEILPADRLPPNQLITHYVTEHESYHQKPYLWKKRKHHVPLSIVIKSGRIIQPASGDGTSTIQLNQGFHEVYQYPSELTLKWAESWTFYHKLLDLGDSRGGKNDVTWTLVLEISRHLTAWEEFDSQIGIVFYMAIAVALIALFSVVSALSGVLGEKGLTLSFSILLFLTLTTVIMAYRSTYHDINELGNLGESRRLLADRGLQDIHQRRGISWYSGPIGS